MAGSVQQIQVSSRTWVQDSHSLFDFEASGAALQSESYAVDVAGACLKSGDSISCVGMGTSMPARRGARPLFKFERREEGIRLTPAARTSSSYRPWVVVKESQGGVAKIVLGDEILLGRALLTVAQVVTDTQSTETPCVWNETVCKSCPVQAADASQCRICLMDGGSEEDPLVQPCLCSGSVANVHEDGNLSDAPVESFSFKTPICEMCKADYPALISTGDGTEPLVDSLPEIKPPYLVLQSSTKSSKTRSRDKQLAYHVVSFAQRPEAKVGRGHEADVRLDEVSMSRWHTSIKWSNGEFTVEDHESKFGTLLALQKPLTVGAEEALSVKVGRSVFAFSMPAETPSLETSEGSMPSEEPMEPRFCHADSAMDEHLSGSKPSFSRTATHDA